MHADGLHELAERIDGVIAEHERAIDVPAVLLGDAVIIAELLKRGGEEGQQIVLPLDALLGAVHGERLNDQYRPFRAVFAVQLAVYAVNGIGRGRTSQKQLACPRRLRHQHI